MEDLKIHTLRSRPLTGGELAEAFRQFKDYFTPSVEEFESAINTEIEVYNLRLPKLPSLEAFGDPSNVRDATVMTGTPDVRQLENFRSMTQLTYAGSLNHSWTTMYASMSPQAVKLGSMDLSISAGLRREGIFCGIYVHRPAPVMQDIPSRRQLFDDIIAEMGLSRQIVTQMGDDVLYMRADQPWKLVYPSHEVPGGGNPLGFYACGFETIDDALAASDRLIERFPSKKLAVSFVTRQQGASYIPVYQRLNELWGPWEVNIIGSMTQTALDILQGSELTENPPLRIPAFNFLLDDTGYAGFGSVLIENSNRYLELATDNAPLEVLKNWASYFPDMQFQPVSNDP